MCLHPQLQYKMGKMIGRIVNSGIGMVITTHIDIIVQHINNMIKLTRHKDCKDICESDKSQFLTLLENHIDLDEIVPISFRRHYYASTGRNHKYPLNAMFWALIIQRLFSIPTESLLLIFLHFPDTLENSVVLPRCLMLQRSLALNRIF